MAQKGSNRRKQAPSYSADTMALRYLAGLALIALGAVILMAVELRLPGNLFDGLRRVCFGLCGMLAYVLPVLPLWAGGLVILSTQRKAPVRPWIFAMLTFIGLSTFMMITGAMEYLDRHFGGAWGSVIQGAYLDSAARLERASGGGAVGTILAWPLWKFLGSVLGTVVVLALIVLCLLQALNLSPSRIRDLVTGQAGRRREQQQSERERMTQEQLAWQQQQAMQQAAWQQQQARIIEQQQAADWQRQETQKPHNQTGQHPPLSQNGGIPAWQEQLAAEQLTMAGVAHQSRIFGRNNPGKKETQDRPFRSRIFGRNKKEPFDGLSDGPALQAGKEAIPQRRTATGAPIEPPVTRWASASEEENEARDLNRARTADGMRRPQDQEQPIAEEEQNRPTGRSGARTGYERPENRARTADEMDASVSRTAHGMEAQEAKTAQEETGRLKKRGMKEGSGAEQAAGTEAPLKAEKTSGAEESFPIKPETMENRATKVPAVQQVIGDAAWQPKPKLPPRPEETDLADEVWTPTPYIYPPLTDLALPHHTLGDTSEEDAMRSRKLEETLASFKVQARVVNVTHGPAISRFELELASGIKVNKVAELEKDIAYGMSATSVRIEAPIPGKSLVGVEVPNRKVATVTLREVLESDKMQSAKSLLTVALGKDIAGTPIVCDLARMPHMLIAGQTGSGKSVCINAIINSLLYRASPDDVKLILVDPKVVELQCYNGIPHLLIPVVNDPHKAAAALAWAVAEMMERYDKFAERKVRNLDGYNSVISPTEKPMSRIVIIIDELADLMMVCKKDVEEYICRLTQLARAAGIHLIVATQRPSVDVITGLIKANIPSRIAFKTAGYVDSRTILDRNGAEQLLGWGDMLYAPTGSFTPTRVQGCFLSDDEVNRIVDHVRSANPSTYDPDILEKMDEIAGGGEVGGADIIINSSDASGGDGGLFEQAVEFAIADGQISTSTLQRRLKIGYARAGRLTDEMEERGIVAAKDGSKPRKCLITREEWEEMKRSTEGMM